MNSADGKTVRLHIEQTGPPEGPPLVLLHGLGSSSQDWMWQRDDLAAAGVRMVMVDARGHGRSEKPYGPYQIEDMADDVVAALDELGIEQVDVCGLSLGGALALTMALNHPERVKRLVIVNAPAYFMGRNVSQLAYFGLHYLLLSALSLPRQARIVAGRVFPRPEQAQLRETLYEQLASNDRRAYKRTLVRGTS